VKPAPVDYIAPHSLDEGLGALADAGGDAQRLAGGQSQIPLLNMRLASPKRLVDLNRVPELAYVREQDGGYAIGAMTRDSMVERHAGLAHDVPLLTEAIGYIGHAAIRNRGTIGGSIAHADPSAELPAVALALDARLTIQGPRGTRSIGASALYLGYLATTLEPDELLTEVWFPKAAPHTGHAWLEFARRHGDFALAGIGVTLTVRDEAITEARIVATGVGGTPVRATAAETILAGSPLEASRTEAAMAALRRAIEPDADVHATTAYRRHLAGVLLERALNVAYARAAESRTGN
jgi:carbon-monoxide dehydrogenase medium subunit